MQGGEAIAIVSVIGSISLAVVTLVRTTLDYMARSRAERVQADLLNRLIDKYGASPELLAHLQSEAGQLVKVAPAAVKGNAYGRILNSVQYGMILATVGGGMLWLRWSFHGQEAADVLLVLGFIALMAGLSLLISGGVSYVLSRQFGLLNGRTPEPQE